MKEMERGNKGRSVDSKQVNSNWSVRRAKRTIISKSISLIKIQILFLFIEE